MDEETLLRMRTLPRICPSLPYAKHTSGLAAPLPARHVSGSPLELPPTRRDTNGAVDAASPMHTSSTVRILAVLCSSSTRRPNSRDTAHKDADLLAEATPGTEVSTSGADEKKAGEDTHDASSAVSRKRGRSAERTTDTGDSTDAHAVEPPSGKKSLVESMRHGAHDTTDATARRVEPPRRGSVYLRVMYDDTLVETLPLELFREKHPQILIDYLMSVGSWV